MPQKPLAMPPPTRARTRCFIISPIGDLISEVHARSELVRKHIILPATRKAGIADEDVTRADQIPQPGIITSQIIQHLYDDELVVADLTDHNANVFYELAIRHATRKAVVLLIQKGERIPFDVAPNRAIHYNLADWESPKNCIDELSKQIEAALNDPLSADNPISAAMDFKALRESSDPTAQILATVVPRLESIELSMQKIEARIDVRSRQLGVSDSEPQGAQRVEGALLRSLRGQLARRLTDASLTDVIEQFKKEISATPKVGPPVSGDGSA
jgi:hypothetical protein